MHFFNFIVAQVPSGFNLFPLFFLTRNTSGIDIRPVSCHNNDDQKSEVPVLLFAIFFFSFCFFFTRFAMGKVCSCCKEKAE